MAEIYKYFLFPDKLFPHLLVNFDRQGKVIAKIQYAHRQTNAIVLSPHALGYLSTKRITFSNKNVMMTTA